VDVDAIGLMIRQAVEPPYAATIFIQADSFSLAYDMLMSEAVPVQRTLRIGHPAIALSAFASELYLKCLICAETGKAPRGHYLKELYDLLSPATRKRICAIWDSEVVPMRTPMWVRMEAVSGSKVPRDLPTNLAESNKAFEKLRYAYEGGLDSVRYNLSDLPTLLRRVILESHPSWGTLRRLVEEFPKDNRAV